MRRISLVASVFALVGVLILAGAASAQQAPQFVLGFMAFADQNPDLVGKPLEDQRTDPIGNAFQQTTNGLLAWHKLDNVVDFTNGSQTFVQTPQGILQRSNDQRFQFEALREPIENQLEGNVEQRPGQADQLFAQAQQQLEQQEAQLEQPDALVALQPQGPAGPMTFRITVENFTRGQPFSPVVTATHQDGVHLFQVGQTASDELADVARDGNGAPLFNLAKGTPGVTRASLGHRIDPGQTATFEIQANPGDKLSMASMLGCTNDGFWGLDNVDLPQSGSTVFSVDGLDAGRENNTERLVDLVDQCNVPFGTPGRRNAEVATIPFALIGPHPGILGVGDLDPALEGWTDPVGRVTVELIGPAQ